MASNFNVYKLVPVLGGDKPLNLLKHFVESVKETQPTPINVTGQEIITPKGPISVRLGDPGPAYQRLFLFSPNVPAFLNSAILTVLSYAVASGLDKHKHKHPVALGIDKTNEENWYLKFTNASVGNVAEIVAELNADILRFLKEAFPGSKDLFFNWETLTLEYGIQAGIAFEFVQDKEEVTTWLPLDKPHPELDIKKLAELESNADPVLKKIGTEAKLADNKLKEALVSEAAPQPKTTPEKYDVVIVGGGLSGLSQAYRLAKEFKKKVLVLEASPDDDLAGGRTRSVPFQVGEDTAYASIGGTWVVLDNHLTFELSTEVGYLPVPDHPEFRRNDLLTGMRDANYLWFALWFEGYKIAKENGAEWWSTSTAKELDKYTLNEWMDTTGASESQKRGLRQYFWAFENYSNGPTDNFSALFAAVIIYKRWHNLSKTGIIPKYLRWEGGTGRFIEKLKGKSRELGVTILSSKAVLSVVQDESGVNAFVKDGSVYRGDYLTIATCPRAVPWIKFYPPLPESHQILSANMWTTGLPGLNVVLGWPTPFWKDPLKVHPAGSEAIPYFKDVYWGKNDEYYAECFELTPGISEPNSKRKPGVIRFLSDPYIVPVKQVLEDTTLSYQDKSDKLGKLSADFYKTFFPEKSKDLVGQYTKTGYFNYHDLPRMPGTNLYYPKNILSRYGAGLRTKHARVYFGGSERGVTGLHWMEGAIARGDEVAYEIAHAYDSNVVPQTSMTALREKARKIILEYKKEHTELDDLINPVEWFKFSVRIFDHLPSFLGMEFHRILEKIKSIFHDIAHPDEWAVRTGWELKVLHQFSHEFSRQPVVSLPL